jgi:hypothetical protein
LVELRKKHITLDGAIKQMHRQPGMDSLAICEMKKQKLRLKEEIERLTNPKKLTASDLPPTSLEDLKENPLAEPPSPDDEGEVKSNIAA